MRKTILIISVISVISIAGCYRMKGKIFDRDVMIKPSNYVQKREKEMSFPKKYDTDVPVDADFIEKNNSENEKNHPEDVDLPTENPTYWWNA